MNLPPRKKQHCTNEGNQYPSGVCLRYDRDAVIPIPIISLLISFVIPVVTFTVIIVSRKSQCGKDQGCSDQGANLTNVTEKSGVHYDLQFGESVANIKH